MTTDKVVRNLNSAEFWMIHSIPWRPTLVRQIGKLRSRQMAIFIKYICQEVYVLHTDWRRPLPNHV
ncbi:hypothetical protein [Pseudomonas phage vB_Pae_CF53a]|nr:hypothetical protein PGPR2_01005 [Pseudomonas aeruginosa PGPR2]KYO80821.1 hypothetical protein LT19_05849 [Pseudomonas aeruginosa]QBI77322.1 hypothetical protein [Pseudomonas phage vB_Pae_CF53a]QBI78019.1 hypothetical protein [Pseudomonas phage vB_Pae_CF183a]